MPDPEADRETCIALDEATALIRRALTANGVPDRAAQSVAAALVAAEAEGQVGHGFSRLGDYVAQLRSGKIVASAEVRLDEAGPAAIRADAGFGFAYPALDAVIERGAAAAARYGTATMAVANSHHCGALSVQVEKLAHKGLLAIMVANTPAAIAPWGARQPVFGTNPIAFAAPREGGDPLVVDLSLSVVARGKIMHARKSGLAIPEGWALDGDGQPTTDPARALEGTMLPIGGAKGTALALMVEVLAAVLTASTPSAQASSFFAAEGPPPGVGQFLIAIQPADDGFAAGLEALLDGIAALDGARLPGTRRAQALREAQLHGIAVAPDYLRLARDLADGRG